MYVLSRTLFNSMCIESALYIL